MENDIIGSAEARAFNDALAGSSVAYSYFDGSDRLRFWNKAYEALNFRIRSLIREGAFFPDLLAELVVRRQIDISGDVQSWIDDRLEARQRGSTCFRTLTDGRVFLVQERRDDIGGTLGFWLDVSDLFHAGALRDTRGDVPGPNAALADHAAQNRARELLQVVMGNLELIGLGARDMETGRLVGQAMTSIQSIVGLLDRTRP